MRLVAIVAPLVLLPQFAQADPAQLRPRVGDEYEIARQANTADETEGESSGSSNDRDTIQERVIATSATGLELEYDLPRETSDQERKQSWQFPVRVFKPVSGPLQLLNGPELEERVDRWLKAAKLTRAACGKWIFTWNAFRIECDPQSALSNLAPFDLRAGDLRDGGRYQDPMAREPGVFTRKSGGPTGAVFVAEMVVDPAAFQKERAEGDVVVGEILKKTVTLEAALRTRSKENMSGTIIVTFETDSAGNVRQKTTLTTVTIKLVDGKIERRTANVVVTRHRVAAGDGQTETQR